MENRGTAGYAPGKAAAVDIALNALWLIAWMLYLRLGSSFLMTCFCCGTGKRQKAIRSGKKNAARCSQSASGSA